MGVFWQDADVGSVLNRNETEKSAISPFDSGKGAGRS